MDDCDIVSSNFFLVRLPRTNWTETFIDHISLVSGHRGNILQVFLEEMFNSHMMVEVLGEQS